MRQHLKFYYGTMASSKTLRLLATAYDFEEKGIQILTMKPSTDTRDGEGFIHSRAGLSRPCITIEPNLNLYEAVKKYNDYLKNEKNEELKWVIIDECQFLKKEQVDQLSDVVDILNIGVMCYGLRTDFKSNLFEGSKRLFELADDIEEVKSTCECGERKTSINARFNEHGEMLTDGEQVEIGGNEKYKAICRKCWKEKIRNIKKNLQND